MAEDTTKVIRIVIDSSKAVDGGREAQRALDAIEKQTGTMAQALDRVQQSIVNVGSVLKAHLALAAAEAVARLVEIAKQSFDAAAGMGELAEQIGLTARELQGLQFIGVQSGASLDDVTTAATKFSVKMGEAAQGSKPVIDALKDLGVKNLDLQGRLRPTADLMAEVAAKITAIEDPARKSAAQVDFFGKSGTKMSAVMADMANGLGDASQKAQQFGAMISDNTIKKLDDLADRFDRSKLRTRAYFAEILADLVDVNDKLQVYFDQATAATNVWGKEKVADASSWLDGLRDGMDQAAVMIARFNGQLVVAFSELPNLMGRAIVDGLNAVLRGLASGLQAINDVVANSLGWLGVGNGAKPGSVPVLQLSGGGASLSDYTGRVGAAGDAAAGQLREKQQSEFDARQAAQVEARRQAASRFYAGSSRSGREDVTGIRTTGAGTSAPKDDGSAAKEAQAQAEKLQKLTDTLNAAVVAQNAMTAAARLGDVAFQEQQASAEATAKAIDFFGGKVAATDPKVKALADTLQKPIFEKMQGAAAQSFVVATTELTKQNDLLAAQIALMNEAPEVQARELAVIKAKQEAQKAGNALTAEDIENRRKAIEANETLKLQAEQLKKAEELWTAPLKQALENIQTAGADAFEQILDSGNFTFQSLAETFTKILKRMAAEFLALATIRPVLSLAVDVIGPGGIGLIGGNTAAQLGFPTSAVGSAGGGGGIGSTFGGISPGSIFGGGGASAGGGWLSRQFGGVSDFLGSPIGGFGGALNGTSPAALAAPNGATGAALGGLGGLTWGGALSGVGSIGMGAYSLLSGGGSTSSMFSGGASILGGGLSLLGPMLGLGAAAGPIGLGVGLLGSLLPSLLGGGGPKIPPMPALAYGSGQFRPTRSTGSYSYTGDALGSGTTLNSQAETLANSLTTAFRTAGLTVVPSALIGGNIASGTAHMWDGKQWADSPYTQTGLIGPDGAYTSLTANDTSRTPDQASQYLLAQAFKANVLQGGVSGAGAGLKTGLEKIDPVTTDDLNRVIQLGTAYDKLGKSINPAKDALDKISASFDDLKSFATEAGLSLDPINAELKKQSVRSAQDFIDGMLDPLAVQMRALDDAKEQALTSAEYIRDNITGVNVDINAIVDYYGKQRVALEDQFYGGAITNLKNLIDRATYGDLANATPTLQLSGTKAAYETALSGARANDPTSITNFAGLAEDYLKAASANFASGPGYEAVKQQIVAATLELQAQLTGGGTSSASGGGVTPAIAANSQQVAQLTAMVQDLVQQLAASDKKQADTNDKLQRLLSAR